ncbi:iron-siderophore ABC transporter substrate-binding protein [Agrococcus versicolor]|uniref:Iron-siderophore ABC transporter substrate-binding protein n=1 Tax=Agrococcus versicolor TaxID=501482 RepID=A0ABN3AWK8_9MICO
MQRALRLTLALPVVAVLAACSSSAPADPGSGAAGDDVITIEHAFGTTEIPGTPERVATVNWANQDIALSLGVVPVGMAAQTYGDDDGDGILPWTAEALDELGGEAPVLFDETDGIDFEAVAESDPDVILAAYSGLTEEDYATLSEIAPTVAYPEYAWGTPWRESLAVTGEALGLEDEAAAVEADIDEQVAAAADGAAFAGLSGAMLFVDPTDLSTISAYTPLDTRIQLLDELGLAPAPSVETLGEDNAGQFFGTVSAEQADTFDDVDLIVAYGDQTLLDQLQADPLLGTIPAIQRGAVALLTDGTPLAAALTPTPLSIPWALDEYVAVFDAAAQNAQ